MIIVLHVLTNIIHVKPLTALVFAVIGVVTICASMVGVVALAIGLAMLKEIANRSKRNRAIGHYAAITFLVGLFLLVIDAPVAESLNNRSRMHEHLVAYPVVTCRTLDECNRMVPLIPGTTLRDGRHGQNRVLEGMGTYLPNINNVQLDRRPRLHQLPGPNTLLIINRNPRERT